MTKLLVGVLFLLAVLFSDGIPGAADANPPPCPFTTFDAANRLAVGCLIYGRSSTRSSIFARAAMARSKARRSPNLRTEKVL